MPIFEYICSSHGKFEELLPRFEEWFCCPVCGILCDWTPSIPTMRPDTMWSGQVHRNYGYHTSEASLKEEMKRRNHVVMGDRTDREGWEKIADEARAAKDEKLKRQMRQWSENTFGPSGLGLGGADGEKFIKEAR